MPRTKTDDYNSQIERVFLHLRKYPEGLRTIEVAEALNIIERTARNYLNALRDKGRVEQDGRHWYVISTQQITLRPFALEAEEAMVLYLAARLFIKQSDKRNISAENVLMKLAEILRNDAQLDNDILEAAQELTQRPVQANYQDTFRTIMRGYLYRLPLKIVYHPYHGKQFETTIKPYLIEPSAIGFSTYVIGHSSIVDDLRTYKIERIVKAEITRGESYYIPPDFPGIKILQNAWSIFYGDETVQVILRFHPDVARRVQETYWHPSQQPVVEDREKSGYVLLRFEVADTTDLKPWIRTWGANCEILQPEALRDEMIGEARRFAELYGWTTHRGPIQADDDDPLGLDTTMGDFFD